MGLGAVVAWVAIIAVAVVFARRDVPGSAAVAGGAVALFACGIVWTVLTP